jgi:hypothetical protein
MLALTIIAVVLSAGALGVSIWAAWSNGRSADAAEDSAVTSRQAAEASKESAEQARRSADAADRVAQAEVSRDHESLAPTLNGRRDHPVRRLASLANPGARSLLRTNYRATIGTRPSYGSPVAPAGAPTPRKEPDTR